MTQILHFISAIFFAIFLVFISILPFRLMYIISDGVAWILRSVLKYRKKVILDNLAHTNLTLSEAEKQELLKQVYKNLADMILEGIKSFGMSEKSVRKRHKLVNPELVEPYFASGRSVILVTGHIGNWEWGALSAGLFTPFTIIGFYKPLTNTYIDAMVKKSRSRFGCILASIRLTSRIFEKHKDTPSMFLMAADQSPSKVRYAYWVDFLGRETAFLHGPERHSRTNDLPVVFADISRKKRGIFEVELSLITDTPELLKEGEITRLYAQKLESVIRKRPDDWLWTHKRWKKKRQAEKTSE